MCGRPGPGAIPFPEPGGECCGGKAAISLEVSVGDIVVLKKNHPCGCNRFVVLRTGVDFKLRCEKCGHEIMTPRIKIEKSVKNVVRQEK